MTMQTVIDILRENPDKAYDRLSLGKRVAERDRVSVQTAFANIDRVKRSMDMIEGVDWTYARIPFGYKQKCFMTLFCHDLEKVETVIISEKKREFRLDGPKVIFFK